MKMNDAQVKISVRDLVEFVLRSGSLDNRRGGRGRELEAMQAGSRIHRKLQSRKGVGYQAEVPLKIDVPLTGVTLTVEGRADGVVETEDSLLIDEIKGVYFDPEGLEEPVPVHLAQAVCYAYILAVQNEHERATVQVTYCNLDTEEIRVMAREYTFEELEQAFLGLVEGYRRWAEFWYEHRKARQTSLKTLPFPFTYREGQKRLAASVYRSIEQNRTLFIQASTGIGKTMSVLYPAMRAVGENLADKIFYLTAKSVTGAAAGEAMEILRAKGLAASSVALTAKEKLCILASRGEEMDCNPEVCPRANGHFDRINEAVFDIITHVERIGRDEILAYAERYQVCPFEFALDISLWVDLIICDYNYVFDPNVKLQRFFASGRKGDYLFLVDEAHNLIDRAREMYSAVLTKEDFLLAKKAFAPISQRISKSAAKCNKLMLELKRLCDSYRVVGSEEIAPLVLEVDRLYSHIISYEEDHPHFALPKELRSFFFSLRDFLGIYDLMDENYRIYTEFTEDGSFFVKLFCVNPAANLSACMEQGNASVFFSATMLPIRYYKHCISGNEEDYAIYAGSPFDRANRSLLVANDVTTKYTSRGEVMYRRAAEYLLALTASKPGNYLAFFPSYKYLREVEPYLEIAAGEKIELFVQQQNMTEQEREEFLARFDAEDEIRKKPNHGDDAMTSGVPADDENAKHRAAPTGSGRPTKLGLAVLGGVFSEGIDLAGSRLIGVAVVGTGFPMVCTEREILRAFYEEEGKDGFDYAYRFPGFNKVEQAVGRLIRTDTDTGAALLLDHRFLSGEYLEQFPEEWSDFEETSAGRVEAQLKRFWESVENRF